jgi:UDP-GlcNAc:undecaprenyl-phosphate GlcNAc-1-phosphate transferase
LIVCPLGLAWVLSGCLIRWAPRLGLVDHPDPRKVHTRPTPRAGGLALFLAVVLTSLGTAAADHLGWANLRLPGDWLPFLGWATPIVFLGLADDLRPLSWQLRLAVQTLLGIGAVVFALPEMGVWFRAAAVFWVVALTNAFNMLDNMDTLSAGTAWVVAGWLAVLAFLAEPGPGLAWGPFVILMGALAGFLWWNWPPARLFMGDAGSTFLGFLLGLTTVRAGSLGERFPWTFAIPVCLAAVPCYDMTSVVILRLSQGRSPFHPDKQHLSHRLVALGLSPVTAVRLIHLLALASGACAVILYLVPTPAAALVLLQLALWWAFLACVEFLRPFNRP